MKRGTPDHPKTHELAAALGLEKWGAVGVLEALFHFAAQYARRGDLGRHTDAAIARGIGWNGKPEKLIQGLVAAGWLDRCRCHRLRVHDWHHHADQTVSRTEEVKKLGFIGCYDDASSLLVADEQETSQPLPLPLPLPTPEPTPEPEFPAPSAPALLVPVPASWSKQACDCWIDRYGGTAPGGQIGKALKPLVEKHGWPAVRQAWRSYLKQSDAEFASASRFAATYGRWSGSAPPGAKPTVADRTRANLEAWVAGKEAAK